MSNKHHRYRLVDPKIDLLAGQHNYNQPPFWNSKRSKIQRSLNEMPPKPPGPKLPAARYWSGLFYSMLS
jgi:hypothetical protein